MTVSIVQSKAFPGASSGAFDTSVTAGNTVFLSMLMYASGVTMSTSSPLFGGAAVTGAAKLAEVQNPATGSAAYAALWMLPAVAGGSAAVALTAAGGNVDAYDGLTAVEVSGLGAAPALDTATPNPATASSTSAGTVSSGSTGAIAGAPALILGALMDYSVTQTLPGTPWSGLAVSDYGCTGWQVVTSPGGTYSYGNGTGSEWAAICAAIKADTGAESGPNYAASAAGLAGGSGTWASASNAAGSGTGTFASWTAP